MVMVNFAGYQAFQYQKSKLAGSTGHISGASL
jgi:hypothetical protein